ncbi:MAG TPA: LysR family transcriptional regulator [Alphaproteobacteria bacterium]|nr:LysR family transcriptional regulator [Alphaproteobacteria bacterium]
MLPVGRLAPELDWNLLRIFSEIVKAGGVSRAADRLCLKQPTVSLALKRLEETLGMVLCKRGPGGFELTDAGALVSETCGRMIEMVDGIPLSVANMRAELRGRIRLQVISGMVNTVFDQAIAAFHGQFPRVEIAIEVSTWDAIGRSLLRHEADIGVAPARFFHAELTYQSLFLERHRPYCGCSHPLFGRRMASARDLDRHAFILTAADEPDELTRYRLRNGLGSEVAGLSENLDEAKRLTLLGLGICFLPEGFAAPEVAEGRLWPLIDVSEPSMEIFIITNRSAPRHIARDLLVEEFSMRAPELV